MKYFKNVEDEIYAYEDDADDEYILPGLVSITEEEATALLNPPLTVEQLTTVLAENQKAQLRTTADAEIAWRQDAVDAGNATEEEATVLGEWRKYRVLLMRVDTSNPEWPPSPQ